MGVAENVSGLEQSALLQWLDQQTYQAEVTEDEAVAARLGLQSTPTVFVDGLKVNFRSGYSAISSAIDAAQPVRC